MAHDTLTQSQMTSLRWHEHRVNHGRGRICGDTSKLLKGGYLALGWTSANTWVLSITDKGRQALEAGTTIAGG